MSKRAIVGSCFVFVLLAALWLSAGMIQFGVTTQNRGATEDAGAEAPWTIPNRTNRQEPGEHAIRRRELQFVAGLPVRDSRSAATWESRGPDNIGGRTRALAFDITRPGVVVAGGATGGVWRSESAGQSWDLVSPPSASDGVTSLVQDIRPGKEDTWYYSTGEGRGRGDARQGSGVYRSDDGGQSWSVLPSTQPDGSGPGGFAYIWRLALNATQADGDVVYAATNGYLYRSPDGGESWNEQLSVKDGPLEWSFEHPTDVAVTPSGSVFFAAGSTSGNPSARVGVFRSVTEGSWQDITPPIWPTSVIRPVIAVDPTNPERVYLLVLNEDPNTFAETFFLFSYSEDEHGGAWENLSASLPSGFRGQYGYNMMVFVHPSRPDTVWFGGVGLYRTVNGFANLSGTQEIGGLHVDQHVAAVDPFDNDQVWVGNDGGVYSATHEEADAGNWTSRSLGYRTTQFYSAAWDRSTPGSRLIIGGTQDNGVLAMSAQASDAEWDMVLPGDGLEVAVGAHGEYVYGTILGSSTVYRMTTDADGIFDIHSHVIVPGNRTYLRHFVLDPTDPNRMYLATLSRETGSAVSVVMRQDRLDAIPVGTFSAVQEGWSELESTRSDFRIRAMDISTESPSNRLFYATEAFSFSTGVTQGRLFRLDDAHLDSSIPAEVTGPDFPDLTIEDIAINPANGNELLVAFAGYGTRSLFHSDDGGLTWSDVGGNLEELPDGSGAGPSAWSVGIVPLPGGRTLYLAGTTSGLFSTNVPSGSSTEWLREGVESIGHSWIEAIDVRASDSMVLAATHGNGVFVGHASATETGTVKGVSNPSVATSAPFPNPTSNEVRIEVSLSRAQSVTIRVLDVTGRSVKGGESKQYSQGAHVVSVHLSGLAAGTYYVVVEAEGRPVVHPITVVRPQGGS